VVETESSPETTQPAAAARRRRAPARRKAVTRKRPASRKKSSRARSRSGGNGFSALLNDMAARAASAGKGLQSLSGRGANAARRALAEVGTTSRKTIARLTKEWEGMDAKRRAQFVAALLAALAAASAPIVRGRLKR
jgi:hypothetical protein